MNVLRHRFLTSVTALLLALGVLLAVASPSAALAAQASPTARAAAAATPVEEGEDGAELVLYWGDGCPYCERERTWLQEVEDDYPELTITQYEVWYDEENQQRMLAAAEEHGIEASGVPMTVIGDKVWIGFSDTHQEEMEAAIKAAVKGADGADPGTGAEEPETRIDVPLLGRVGLDDKSLLVSTIAIGFVDGINPCSLWVISVLLAIVVRTGSRRRVVAIGTTFLLITATMYAVFMAGIYSALSVASHLGAIQLVVALVAGIFGAVSVKDYFAFKKGLSFTIPESSKPGIYKRMRAAAGQQQLLPALGATAVLAVGVSLLETPCTAGFPVLWTGMLADQGVGPVGAAALFVVYMVPFLVDEFLVFGIAVATMRATKMQEKHGQLLKLVAGTTMLALAGTMLVRPETMEDPWGALAVFVLAFAVAGLVHAITTKVRQARAVRRTSGVRSTAG